MGLILQKVQSFGVFCIFLCVSIEYKTMIKNVAFPVLILCAVTLWGYGFQSAFGFGASVKDLSLKGPVVVELFTSQSCSSCPAADKVLSELAENENVIALGCHVTYWNHLHWEDTLSKPDCTNRQRAYAAHMKSRRVYTPQMVVNGGDAFVGSYRGEAFSSLERAHPLHAIDLILEGERINISLPVIEIGSYKLMVFGSKKSHTQHVPRGENRGRTLHYHNSVLFMQSAGDWDGKAQDQSLDVGDISNYDHIVVIAQKDGFGPILAAGRLNL